MRKILLVSVVLLIAAPAFAGNVSLYVTNKGVAGNNGWATIGYTADTNVSGFGLKLYTDSSLAKFTGDACDYNVGESNAVKQGYGIFPGTIQIDSNGNVTSYGSPVCPNTAPGAAGSGPTTSTLIVEMGALYKGDPNKPPRSTNPAAPTTLISVKVSGYGDCNVCAMGEPVRGKVVFQDATAADANVCTVFHLPAPPYDFGDLPDPPYPTLKANGGPYHLMATSTTPVGPMLGPTIVAEADGQPSINADLAIDDDGVTFSGGPAPKALIVHEKGYVTVVVNNAGGYLNGWIDWNNNGSFNDNMEWVVQNRWLNTGSNLVDFNVPGESNYPCENTTLYSRWRISSDPNYNSNAYAGYMSSGEVEDYHNPNDVNQQLWWHVPNVVGQVNTVALAALLENGLRVHPTYEYNSVVPQGYIIRTEPPYCTYPSVNDVNMVTSLGPQLLPVYKLTVTSRDTTGVSITVSPNDNNGLGNGSTVFTRDYYSGTVVTLTAPSSVTYGGHTYNFKQWDKDGNTAYASTQTTSLTMDAAHTMQVEFECFNSDNASYTQWSNVGKPCCWCYPRQCHGDADGLSQGKSNYWVSANDLTILSNAWNIANGPTTTPGICADFDHLPQGKSNYRVSANDLTILSNNWNIANGPAGDCVPGNRTPATCP